MFRQGNAPIAANGLPSVHWYLSRTAIDIIVCGFLLVLGALQLYMSRRADDFYAGDVTYFELARSIIEKGFYGFDFKAQTTLPPGFPLILASLCITVGCNYAVFVRSMVVFATLGFIASYQLICILEKQNMVATAICLLLASSPLVFAFSSSLVFSDLPYFFASVLTLLLALRLDAAKNPRARVVLWPLCGFLLTGSLLIRSSGIALLIGLTAWLVVSLFSDREAAARRFKVFVPLLVLGIVVQAGWMGWAAKHESLQWPMVEGYPKSYIDQLRVKDGNYPELGTASLGDIPLRVARNLNDQAVGLTTLLTRKDYINRSWFSPLIFGCVFFVLLGLAGSIWPEGGNLPEWYFISHETIYLLWPWYGEIRFFLPVAPLACLYLWRGVKTLLSLASRKPRAVGAWSLPVSISMSLPSGVSALHSRNLQPAVSVIFWVVVTTAAGWLAWTGSYRLPEAVTSLWAHLKVPLSARGKSLAGARIGGIATVATLVVVGLAQQLAIGRDNLKFEMTSHSTYADVLAGKWAAANTAGSAVVMARQPDLVYHYSRRKVVWFPPSSDAQLLMEGIRKHKVEYIIVTERRNNYWLPPESVCFESLLRAYPRAFQLVHEEPRFRIFKFVPEHS